MTSNTQMSISTRDERGVLEVLQKLYAAWSDHDADAFAALYTDDATVVLPGGVYQTSKDEVRTYMAAGFAGPLKGSTAIDEPQSVRFLGDDAAVVVSEAGILMAGETELLDERRRRATWVLTRPNGSWLIAAYHNCAAS